MPKIRAAFSPKILFLRVSQSIYFADPDRNEIELDVDDDPRIWRSDPSAVATAEPFEL